MKTSGGLLSIPDFELSRDGQENRITVFIDGWTYHQDPLYFFGDVRKRNELSGRGYRVVTLPAGVVLGKPDYQLIQAILSDAKGIIRPFPVVEGMEFLPELIPNNLDPVVKEQILFLGVDAKKMRLINYQAGIEFISQANVAIAKVLVEHAAKLPEFSQPRGLVGEDKIVMRVRKSEILANQESWKSFWIFYSCLSVVGYRPILIWVDPKPPRLTQ
jgi:hypothetical protein